MLFRLTRTASGLFTCSLPSLLIPEIAKHYRRKLVVSRSNWSNVR